MERTHWAIDLGTTNSLIARWVGTHAETVRLDEICELDPAWNTPLVPSIVCFQDENRAFIGKQAIAGEELLRASYACRLTPVARAFKLVLARDSRQAVAEVEGQPITARHCAMVFLRELIRFTEEREHHLTGGSQRRGIWQRLLAWLRREGFVADLTMTVPVESFEAYRMELQNISRKLGVQHFRTLDEPVAAALGYGVDLTENRNILVVDFGGGTLHLALVRTLLSDTGEGRRRGLSHRKAEVLAARGLSIGGETVDEWVTDMACARLEAHADKLRPLLRAQAERVKKELSGKVLKTDETVFLLPGGETLPVSREEFLATLEEKGLYRNLEMITDAVLGDATHRLSLMDIEAVLLVGGSTLLPGVRTMFEKRFGADRVHYWKPFEAVVEGGAIFGAGFYVDQIIHHDYAIRVFSEKANTPQYELLIRRGTPYPTPKGFQTRYYKVAPRQQLFSLPVCEVGLAGRLSLDWKRHPNGNYYWQPKGTEEEECVVALNEGDAIRLYPPGAGDSARLRVDFTIDEDRWLCATVHDLLRQRDIRTNERVIRLR